VITDLLPKSELSRNSKKTWNFGLVTKTPNFQGALDITNEFHEKRRKIILYDGDIFNFPSV